MALSIYIDYLLLSLFVTQSFNIQEVKSCSRIFSCKVDGTSTTVKMVNELLKTIFHMSPNRKYIVNISHLDQRIFVPKIQEPLFQTVHKNIGIGRSKFDPYGCTQPLPKNPVVNLKVIVFQH